MWSGDISAMGHLADRLADLAGVPSRAAAKVSRELGHLIEEEFDAGADPYGTAWSPLAQATTDKGRTAPPLTDTRTMRDSVRVRPLPRAGVGITISHPAAPHQTGWNGKQGSGPARPILPARAELPPLWSEAIEAAVLEEFRR
jgi:Phage virion morphogenesis family